MCAWRAVFSFNCDVAPRPLLSGMLSAVIKASLLPMFLLSTPVSTNTRSSDHTQHRFKRLRNWLYYLTRKSGASSAIKTDPQQTDNRCLRVVYLVEFTMVAPITEEAKAAMLANFDLESRSPFLRTSALF